MKLIALSQGKFAQVDDEDYDYLMQWKWWAGKSTNVFYAGRNVRNDRLRTTIKMHRIIMGYNSHKLCIDHIDGDGLNNQRCNLRFATKPENNMNKKSSIGSSSVYKGVCWDKNSNKWISQIRRDGRKVYFKRFINEIDAAKQYDIWAKELFKDFAKLNFI